MTIEIAHVVADDPNVLARIVEEMKRYARQTEFDYEGAYQEAKAMEGSKKTRDVTFAGRRAQFLQLRTDEQMKVMEPYTRFLLIKNEPLQVIYLEFQVDGNWYSQLQLLHGLERPLGGGALAVTEMLLDMEKPTMIAEGTPRHVVIIYQEVLR